MILNELLPIYYRKTKDADRSFFPSFTVGKNKKRSEYAENTGKKSVDFIWKKYIYQRILSRGNPEAATFLLK